MNSLPSITSKRMSFMAALWLPLTRIRAFKVAIVVGTLLILINQGDFLIAGIVPPVWKILLTYLVPYSVSSYSTAAFILDYSAHGPP